MTAYAAACVPGLRSLRGGLGDGASFNANPSVGAIAHMLEQWELCVEYGYGETYEKEGEERTPLLNIMRRFEDPRLREDGPSEAHKKRLVAHGKGELLAKTKLLSVGSGQALPALGYANLDVGLSLWQQLPTSPFDGTMLPSGLFALDAPTTSAEYTCRRLLGEERSLRLNPDLMHIPTVMASMMALNPMLRSAIQQMIRTQTDTAKSRNAIENTSKFVSQYLYGTDWYVDSEARQQQAKKEVRQWSELRSARAEARKAQRGLNPFWQPRAGT